MDSPDTNIFLSRSCDQINMEVFEQKPGGREASRFSLPSLVARIT